MGFVNQVIDIELAYINTNHPDFISMDDVFTERANHHSQNEMYQQISHQSDDEQIESQHKKSRERKVKQSNNPQSHPLNNSSSNMSKERIKSAPSPPQNREQNGSNK